MAKGIGFGSKSEGTVAWPGIAGFQGGRNINIPYAKVSVGPARGFIARRNFTAEETSPRSQNLTPFYSTVRKSYPPCRVLSIEMLSYFILNLLCP